MAKKPPKIIQPFSNTKEHFDAYIKARDVLSQEIKYRRDRQWEIIKWVSGLFLALIGFLFTLKTRGVPLDIVQLLTLTCVVLLLATGSCLRIIHDAGVVECRHRVCRAMDKKFNLYFSDARYKFSTKMSRWWRFFQYSRDKSHFSYYAKKRMLERRLKSKGKAKSSLSFLVWCYILFISMMAALVLVSSWSMWDTQMQHINRLYNEGGAIGESGPVRVAIRTRPTSLSLGSASAAQATKSKTASNLLSWIGPGVVPRI